MTTRDRLGCSTEPGAGVEATATPTPPARECVRRVWAFLSRVPRLPEVSSRAELAEFLDEQTDRRYLTAEPGQEHYALLEFLGAQFRGHYALDFGTYRGASALALAASCDACVVTVDCYRAASDLFYEEAPGIVTLQEDLVDWLETEGAANMVKDAPLIVMDVSHDGWTERHIYRKLEEIGFNGILILDDINMNDAMRRFWCSIERPKLDLTGIGHHSGTGAVLFEGAEHE